MAMKCRHVGISLFFYGVDSGFVIRLMFEFTNFICLAFSTYLDWWTFEGSRL